MATKEQLQNALRNADAAGDTEAARRFADLILTGQFETPAEVGARDIGRTATRAVASAVTDPLIGIGGLAVTPFVGAERAGAGIESAQAGIQSALGDPTAGEMEIARLAEEYIPQPSKALGETTFEATESPVTAAVAETVPEAAMQVLGLKAPAIARALLRNRKDISLQDIDEITAEIEAITEGGARTPEEVAEAITTESGIAELAQFDEAVLRAASELGFEEVPPSVAAGNRQFRDIAQGLASISGSQAKAQYGEFLEALSNRADELIEEGGGSLDKPAVSSRFREETNNVIDSLGEQETVIYSDILATIGRPTKVNAPAISEFIAEQVNDFGGVNEMPKVYQDVYNLMFNAEGRPTQPTYAAFEQKRKDIGAALGRKSSPYSDAEEGALRRIYGALKQDQRNIAESFGQLEQLEAANALTVKRKALENTATELLGRNLSKDLMTEISSRIAGLPRGNVTKFKETIESIPESLRTEVVVSGLNDLLKGTGADQKGFGAARFVGMMNELKRSPTAKAALYKYLPKETRKSLDNFYTLANAVYKANRETINTGKITQFFPDTRGFLNRMMGNLGRMALSSKAGPVGAAAADEIVNFMRNTTPKARAANDLISSPKFQTLMREAVRDGVHEGNLISKKTQQLENMVKRSNLYDNWLKLLDGDAAAEIASLGLTNYLMNIPQDQNKEGDTNGS